MLQLTFKQTDSEIIVRAAATVLFNSLTRCGIRSVNVSELAEQPQYGFTASAAAEPVGPKLVRITDLQDGQIDWNSVPYCECAEPSRYLLRDNDVLFARTGATTGKTHLVKNPERAVFASYLIRLRPRKGVLASYLHAFFQSDNYWAQISEEKEGSAQPNVNGEKLSALEVPLVEPALQHAISEFLRCVRSRQDGHRTHLPELPPPLDKQRRVVERIEVLSTQIHEARALRHQSTEETDALLAAELHRRFVSDENAWTKATVGDAADIIDPNPSHRMPRYSVSGVPFISTVDFEGTEGIRKRTAKHVEQETYLEQVSRCKFAPGDILYSRIGTIGEARELREVWPFALSHVLVVVKPKAAMLPRFLLWYLRSDSIISQSDEATRSVGVPDLGIKRIRAFHMPFPLLNEQRRIVAELDGLQAEVDALKRLQAETAAKLDALLPAILDRAFKGEL